jgi:hypothetical protein
MGEPGTATYAIGHSDSQRGVEEESLPIAAISSPQILMAPALMASQFNI